MKVWCLKKEERERWRKEGRIQSNFSGERKSERERGREGRADK